MLSRLLIAALLVSGLSACGSRAEYGEELVQAEGHKVIDVDDGRKVALSSTGHVLYAQWGEDGSWTKPDEVYRDDELWMNLGDVQALDADDTVAFSVDLSNRNPDMDEDNGVRSVLVVCHDGTCENGRAADHLESADMDAKGRVVAYELSRRELLVWQEEGSAFRTASLADLPADARTLVTEDGAIVAVGWTNSTTDCVYSLYTADDDLHWKKAVSTPGPGGLCGAAGAETKGDDRVEVYVEGAQDDIAFVREGGEWRADVPEHPAMAYPYTDGRETLHPVGGSAGKTSVLVGSPDGTRILAQWRASRDDEWSEPAQVASAPGGTRCGFGDAAATREQAIFLVRCFPTDDPPRDPTDVGPSSLVLATANGTDWQVLPLKDGVTPQLSSEVDRVLVSGSEETLVFASGEDEAVHARLPLSSPRESVTFGEGDELIRVTCNRDAWAPTYSLASFDATRWSTPVRLPGVPADLAGRQGPCRTLVWRDAQFYAISFGSELSSWEGSFRRTGDRLELVEP